jgi:flagellar basal-body rod modification protein FlgD
MDATTSATTPATTGRSGGTTSGAAAPTKTTPSDYDTFLQMLTTQMKYQDPLNPIDSADFAVQLATFSSVEQQQLTNELLEGMSSQLGFSDMAELASWVGKTGRAPVAVQFDGTPVTLAARPDPRAQTSTLVVSDATGAVVSRLAGPATDEPFEWQGRTDEGSILPQGRYSFSLESETDGKVISTTPVEVYRRIVEARAGSSGTMLVMEGGIQVAADKVTALRGD